MQSVNIFGADKPGGRLDVAQVLGSSDLMMFVYDLDPGTSSSPYHYEYAEEWLLVVDGTIVLRAPDGEHTLQRGDLVRRTATRSGSGGQRAGRADLQARHRRLLVRGRGGLAAGLSHVREVVLANRTQVVRKLNTLGVGETLRPPGHRLNDTEAASRCGSTRF